MRGRYKRLFDDLNISTSLIRDYIESIITQYEKKDEEIKLLRAEIERQSKQISELIMEKCL